ncbi:hypothetical protein [Aurantimonas coralicida]|uniref:hypothetical protein n=1 Tax=Aurantimonas coralicida TaxID=182270 RepID=UPI001E3E43BF|nr:hypothetical protein [Aurantimonas coralicida]MCD1645258.1 hypothetical protein [Aurantimonas coralicida]
MKITNIAAGQRGFWHKGRLVSLAPGETAEYDLSPEERGGVTGNPESFSLGAKGEREGEKQLGMRVHDKGRGWFVVMDGDAEVTKNLRADDVDGFDAMSDEDKAAFIELHKAD